MRKSDEGSQAFTLEATATIEGRISLKHSVHNVCVQDKFPLRPDAASRSRGIAEATRPDEIEKRICFPEQ
jgi:hypothetical protein